MNKIEVIAPIVHAARVAYRQVHAPGKLLPEWPKAEQAQKNEVFAVVRETEHGGTKYTEGTEGAYLAAVTAQCFKALFPEPVGIVDALKVFYHGEPVTDATPEPAPRRGRR